MASARQRAMARCAKSRQTPGALGRGIVGGGHRIGRAVQIFHVAVDPVADLRDAQEAGRDVAKLLQGKPHQHVGFAIAARVEIRHDGGRQIARRDLDEWRDGGSMVWTISTSAE